MKLALVFVFSLVALINAAQVPAKCNERVPCPGDQGCINGYCQCPADTLFQNGRCRPIPWGPIDPSCATVQCPEGSTCANGRCSIVSTAAPTTTVVAACTCAPHHVCLSGRCHNISTRPDFTTSATKNYEPSCAAVRCLAGSTCKNGKCSVSITTTTEEIIDFCGPDTCPMGYTCFLGMCTPATN